MTPSYSSAIFVHREEERGGVPSRIVRGRKRKLKHGHPALNLPQRGGRGELSKFIPAQLINSITIEPLRRKGRIFPPVAILTCPPEVKLLSRGVKKAVAIARPKRGRKLIPEGSLPDTGNLTRVSRVKESRREHLDDKRSGTKRERVKLITTHSFGGGCVIHSAKDAVAAMFESSEPDLHVARNLKRLPKAVPIRRAKERITVRG
jgi:hypothetical protein